MVVLGGVCCLMLYDTLLCITVGAGVKCGVYRSSVLILDPLCVNTVISNVRSKDLLVFSLFKAFKEKSLPTMLIGTTSSPFDPWYH